MISFLFSIIICIVALAILTWIAGAIYFDVGKASVVGALFAFVWVAATLGIFVAWQPTWKPFLLLLICGGCFICWWLSQRPSLERPWDPRFAQLPRVTMQGDKITIDRVRNADYEITGVATPRYESRSYHFSELCGVDALIAYWGSPCMCHPMFVFDFGPDGHICFSIELRYRIGQKYNFLRSLYRQQELMCVACDERDAILCRIKQVPAQDVYLYRLHGDALRMRNFFLEYAITINSLAERPRWYHGLTSNCTTSIYSQARGHIGWDWRMLFNGRFDELLYDLKLLDQTLQFPQLKEQSRINDLASGADVENFGETIRSKLPAYRQSLGLDHKNAEALGSQVT